MDARAGYFATGGAGVGGLGARAGACQGRAGARRRGRGSPSGPRLPRSGGAPSRSCPRVVVGSDRPSPTHGRGRPVGASPRPARPGHRKQRGRGGTSDCPGPGRQVRRVLSTGRRGPTRPPSTVGSPSRRSLPTTGSLEVRSPRGTHADALFTRLRSPTIGRPRPGEVPNVSSTSSVVGLTTRVG